MLRIETTNHGNKISVYTSSEGNIEATVEEYSDEFIEALQKEFPTTIFFGEDRQEPLRAHKALKIGAKQAERVASLS